MRTSLAIVPLALALLAGCGKTDEPATTGQPAAGAPAAQSAPVKQDVTTEALAKIDPEVTKYDAAVADARTAYEKTQSAQNKTALIDAYIRFGDYMTYESPVSPRQGKYHRALIEYRHALALDPSNAKAQEEIKQIEDIYRSMGRPIPGDDV